MQLQLIGTQVVYQEESAVIKMTINLNEVKRNNALFPFKAVIS